MTRGILITLFFVGLVMFPFRIILGWFCISWDFLLCLALQPRYQHWPAQCQLENHNINNKILQLTPLGVYRQALFSESKKILRSGFILGVMLKIMKPTKNNTSGTFILFISIYLHCTGIKVGVHFLCFMTFCHTLASLFSTWPLGDLITSVLHQTKPNFDTGGRNT